MMPIQMECGHYRVTIFFSNNGDISGARITLATASPVGVLAESGDAVEMSAKDARAALAAWAYALLGYTSGETVISLNRVARNIWGAFFNAATHAA